MSDRVVLPRLVVDGDPHGADFLPAAVGFPDRAAPIRFSKRQSALTGHSRGVNRSFERLAHDGTIPGLFNTWRQSRRPVFATARREGHAASGLCPTNTSGSEGLLRFSAKSVCAQGQTGVSSSSPTTGGLCNEDA
jgi:hypothetical protein